ncbi:MAG: DNA-binding protein [Rubrivivax sp.]|nr:MAG: DNA-binding protein [Rubrivivax sp.]
MTPPLNAEQSAMVRLAHRAIAPTLSSQAPSIALTRQGRDYSVQLPPQAWTLVMQLLEAMGQCRAVVLVPDKSEYSIDDAADYLAVSPRFVTEEIDAGRLPHVDRDGRRVIPYPDLETYEHEMHARQEEALQVLSDFSQELDPKA